MGLSLGVPVAVKERPIFALRLAQARERLGWSQAELGRRAGLDPLVASPRINQYERGRHVPHHATVKRLAKVLGVPASFLFAEDDQLARLLLLWASATPAQKKKLLRQVEDALKSSTR